MATQVGFDGVAGYDCTLSIGGDTIAAATDVDPTVEADEQDITTRDTAPWEDWQHGLKRLTADITALWVASASGLSAIETAYFNDDTVSFSISGPAGGYSGQCGILSLNPGQNMDDAVTIDISIKSRGEVTSTSATS